MVIIDNTPEVEMVEVKGRKSKYVACGILILILALILGINYINLQSRMNNVLKNDPRNLNISVSVHYEKYLNPNTLVYDLKGISKENSMADIFRVFLQFAESVKDKKFDVVELSFNGVTKFKITGVYFNTLGQEYSTQNPIYTIRTFTENIMKPDSTKAYSQWTGGWLGVMTHQMEDFNEFHKDWYLKDIASQK